MSPTNHCLQFLRRMRYAGVLVTALCTCQLTFAAPAPEDYEAQANQARLLVTKAVEIYRKEGDLVLAQISRQGGFTTAESYVYVISTQGVMLASGGPSAVYIGRNIRPMLDDQLRSALDQALAEPETAAPQSRDYRWMNWKDGKREPKRVLFQRVGDKVFAAGYFMPRSSEQDAQRLLNDAVGRLQAERTQSIERINKLDPFFNRDDLYVFVIDEKTRRFVAHGALARLVGSDVSVLRAADGELIGEKIINALKDREQGEVSYVWRNPVTGAKEIKHTLLRRQGQLLIAVGYYTVAPTAR
ncbi:cache domain-containing protein [Pseudomonas bharatica]|uniref:cache domain-containing protein n=1 Tax=Pseudomonas bharatica TaxID=2692112 RepID=UPI003B284817